MVRTLLALLFLFCWVQPATAALQTKTLEYAYGGKTFKGHLAWDDSFPGKRPAVLVVHEFWGLNDYAKSRTEQLAKLGYVAFAADMYGDGKFTEHPAEARAMAETVRNNLTEWLGRANAALQTLRNQAQVDPDKLAAIGYCFGGATVLQMAYAGADLKVVASFHGALPVPKSTQDIKGEILIFHGEEDSFIPQEAIQSLRSKFDAGKVRYRFLAYPKAVHSFTVPGSEKRGIPGAAYNAEADRLSWQELLATLGKTFSVPPVPPAK